MSKFMIRRLAVVALLVGLLGYLTLNAVRCSPSPANIVGLTLPSIEKVVDEAKYKIIPIYELETASVYFEIIIESFQNPEALEVDFTNQLLMEDDKGVTYLPVAWNFKSQEEFNLVGVINFEGLHGDIEKVKLIFFGMDETPITFEWKLPK
ncbi:hypothetical protein HOH87_06405 [bacterium]|jgi:hypothetical protein|nr:hypothetical protein [bacterium]